MDPLEDGCASKDLLGLGKDLLASCEAVVDDSQVEGEGGNEMEGGFSPADHHRCDATTTGCIMQAGHQHNAAARRPQAMSERAWRRHETLSLSLSLSVSLSLSLSLSFSLSFCPSGYQRGTPTHAHHTTHPGSIVVVASKPY